MRYIFLELCISFANESRLGMQSEFASMCGWAFGSGKETQDRRTCSSSIRSIPYIRRKDVPDRAMTRCLVFGKKLYGCLTAASDNLEQHAQLTPSDSWGRALMQVPSRTPRVENGKSAPRWSGSRCGECQATIVESRIRTLLLRIHSL